MNIQKLFETQRLLDDRIEKEHPIEKGENRLQRKVLGLQTEIAELANEQRSWKFWSKDQKPRRKVLQDCPVCDGTGDLNYEMVQEDAEGTGNHEYIDCEDCGATGKGDFINPLLEEYVDSLHFILSIGNDLGLGDRGYTPHEGYYDMAKSLGIEKLLMGLMSTPIDLVNGLKTQNQIQSIYADIFIGFRVLGELLGFTWDEVEQAYYAKNQINHERQATGY